MLMFSEKQIHKARAHFRGEFPESLEDVLCGYSCTDGGRLDWVECTGNATTLRWVAFADYGIGAGRGPAVCGRSRDRRKLLWRTPSARETRAWGRWKTPVIGLLKRGGKVFTEIVENCSKQALMPIIKGQVLSEATIDTDGWKSYDGLVLGGDKHHRIHHHQNQFARGRNHVNGIESFWSFTKLRLSKLRGIRAEYFIIHLKESEWRWNHRHDNLYLFLLKNLRSEPL